MRTGTILLAAGSLGLGALAPGCYTNACLLTVCDGPYCRCSISTCGEGATYDARIGRCRCLPGRALLGGHCLVPRVADVYCGPGYHYANGGCYLERCRPGDELDHASGMCIPHEQVNQVASNMGVNVGPGQKLGCPEGQKLVIDGQNAACVPLEKTCARDETWSGQACVKVTTCPEGATWDTAQAKCVEYAKGSKEEGLAVDVAEWAHASYGRDGGGGTTAFCNAFAKRPWSFGVNEGSAAKVNVAVTVSFKDEQIAGGEVTTAAAFAASGNPVPAKAAAEVLAAAKAVFAPLAQQGGRAATASAKTTVSCLVTNAARPLAVPATGGL
jgi:hypothetical protein